MNLSPNFTLEQLTRTDHADLQEANRNVTPEEIARLVLVAELLETCRTVLACDLDIHSGRRSPELNKRVGGGPRSEHLKSTAVDFSPKGPDTETSVADAWQKIVTAARAGRVSFGQLIFENAMSGREGRKFWIHISLAMPYRDRARCGEVLSMKDGAYTVIAWIPT